MLSSAPAAAAAAPAAVSVLSVKRSVVSIAFPPSSDPIPAGGLIGATWSHLIGSN
jgi:hypothetical protein